MIDLENVKAPTAIKTLDSLLKHEGSSAIVMYTNYSAKPKDILKFIEPSISKRIVFHKCASGKNQLDFQLVALLGMLCARYPKRTFIVISDDHGYDSAIELLNSYGYHVFRNNEALVGTRTKSLYLPCFKNNTEYSVSLSIANVIHKICGNDVTLNGEAGTILSIIEKCNGVYSDIETNLHILYKDAQVRNILVGIKPRL